MLADLLTARRHTIVEHTTTLLARAPLDVVRAANERLDIIIGLFIDALRESVPGPRATADARLHAAHHTRDLVSAGFSVAELIHYYGAVGDAVLELAAQERIAVTPREFRVLQRQLHEVTAAAASEHEQVRVEQAAHDELRRLGEAAHELRDLTNSAILGLKQLTHLKQIDSEEVALLGRSLVGLQYTVDSMVSGVRLTAKQHRRERVTVAEFLGDVASIARLHAQYRGLQFRLEPAAPTLAIDVDPVLMTSAVMNLLHNGFKNTRSGGCVVLRARADETHVRFEVEDECGGIPDAITDVFNAFGERRGRDRRGLGLGLAMARDAARANGGEIRIRNMPGQGCVFVLELPLATGVAPDPLPSPSPQRPQDLRGRVLQARLPRKASA